MIDAIAFYRRAKTLVFEAGYEQEYSWQLQRNTAALTDREFLQEYAWVVLTCGFREAIVRRVFPFVSLAFFDFTSARAIVDSAAECVRLASAVFRNRRKLDAIVEGAALVASVGIRQLTTRLLSDKGVLSELPFIGEVTSMHLLKNLGVNVAKNDRHLARLSVELGFLDAADLCGYVRSQTGEPEAAVDIVLWRYCTLSQNAG